MRRISGDGGANRAARFYRSIQFRVKSDRLLVLKPDNQPAYRLAPQHGRRFRTLELEGFLVEFRGEGTIVDEVIFHQPNGTFIAKRVED
jgi:hypothetical protein